MFNLILTIVLQLLLGYLSTILTYALGIGDGWELPAFILLAVLAVYGIGMWRQKIHAAPDGRKVLFGTIIGAVLGALLLASPLGPFGFQGALFPTLAALLGYHITRLI